MGLGAAHLARNVLSAVDDANVRVEERKHSIEVRGRWGGGGGGRGGGGGACLVIRVWQGECAAFGTKGVPATPRDGAVIEITCLCYSALRWLLRVASLHPELLVLEAVVAPDRASYTLDEWATAIKDNFERVYHVPMLDRDDASHDIAPALVNRCVELAPGFDCSADIAHHQAWNIQGFAPC